jgi:hypothetical protein
MVPRRLVEAFSVLLSVLLIAYPLIGATNELIGVGRAVGPAVINGDAFADGASLYSGDRIQTGVESNFLLVASPAERTELGPESAAQIRKDGEYLIIGLEAGKAIVRSAGKTVVLIEKHDLRVRPIGNSGSLAELTIVSPQRIQVSALRGSFEISGGEVPTILNPNETALITDDTELAPEERANVKYPRKRKLGVVILVGAALAGATVGVVEIEKEKKKPPKSPHKP